MERKAYEMIVTEGKLFYKHTGEILETTAMEDSVSKWIFVLSTSKVLYIGKKIKGMFHHSSFLAGGATLAAGRLVVENGLLKGVWPHSGHYKPSEENFMEFLSFLREKNVDITNVKISPIDEDEFSFHKQSTTLFECPPDVERKSEPINHILFECPPSVETCTLSNIPSVPIIFLSQPIYANFDYLFWRIRRVGINGFLRIIWYIWKVKNDKIFNNIDRDPIGIFKIAYAEANAWESIPLDAEIELTNVDQHEDWVWLEADYRFHIDGSWKVTDNFAGLGWYCTHRNKEECIMGTRNVRRSLTPLHAEVEALIWALTCMVTRIRSIDFATDCSELMTSPLKRPALAIHPEEIESLNFLCLRSQGGQPSQKCFPHDIL